MSYHPPTEERRCTAKSKQTGDRCQNWSVPGRAVCRFHGGHGGRPAVSGRYSRALRGLKDKYETALEDDRLLDLRETLAVLDAALMEQMELAEQGAAPQSWHDAFDLLRKFMKARDADPETARELFKQLYKTLQDGSQRQQAMEALQKAAERKAIRAEAAWRIRLDAAQAINVRDLITIFTRLVLLIEDEIGPAQAKGVVDRIDRELLGGALSGSPEQATRTLAGRRKL